MKPRGEMVRRVIALTSELQAKATDLGSVVAVNDFVKSRVALEWYSGATKRGGR